MLTTTDPIERHVTQLRLKGTGTGLRAGDAILIVGDERSKYPHNENWDFRILEQIEVVPDKGYTRVAFSLGLGDQHPTEVGPAQKNPRFYALRLRAALFGHNAPEWDNLDPDIKLREAPRALEVITGVAFSPKGAQALCSTVDGTLRLWDVSARRPLMSIEGHIGSVNSAVYSPDGRFIVSGGDDGTVRVWDAVTGKELRRFTGHRGPVLSVACGSYSEQYEEPQADGSKKTKTRVKTLAVSGGTDSDICVWDLDELPPEESPLIKTLSRHKGAVNGVGLHVAGTIPLRGSSAAVEQRLVSGSDDGSVLLWEGCLLPNTKAGEPRSLGTHVGAVEAVAIPANGARIASGGADGQVQAWTLSPSGAPLSHSTYASGAAESITSLTFSSNAGNLLVGKADGVLLLFDLANGSVTSKSAHAGPVLAVAWSPTIPHITPHILSGGADRKLQLWNTALGEPKTLASTKPEDVSEWPDFGLKVNSVEPQIELDSLYPSLVPGSWIVLARTGYAETYRVTDADVHWATGFSLSSKVTRLSIDGVEHLTWFGRRNTTIHAQSEPLEFYVDTQPVRSPLHGRGIELSALVQGLEAGRRVVVTGQRMRARIGDATGLLLVSVDGYSSRGVAAGDLLVCLAPPYPDHLEFAVTQWRQDGDRFIPVVRATSAGASVRPALQWYLRDRNGFEGYVTVPLARQADGSYLGTQIAALRPLDKDENKVSEVAVIERVIEVERVRHKLQFTAELTNLFDYENLTVSANVARATHGETVALEVLGSGDGTLANQRFALRKKPLTHVSAPTASGGESTLELRVNDVLWKEVPSLHDLDARSQSYLVRRDRATRQRRQQHHHLRRRRARRAPVHRAGERHGRLPRRPGT